MNKLLIGVLAGLLLALTWLALGPSGDSPQSPATDLNRSLEPKQSEPAELQAAATQTELLVAGEPASSADARAAVTGVEVPNKSPEVGQGAHLPEDVAGLRGRFLLPDGSPAEGVVLRVQGWSANGERELQFGKPKEWRDPKGTSDAEGRFFLPFDPPRAYQFTLDARLPKHGLVSWRWSSLPTDQVVDLGDVLLVTSGRVSGRLSNSSGQALTGQWSVLAAPQQLPEGLGRSRARVAAAVDPISGEFILEGLPPGRAELDAQSQDNAGYVGGEVEVRAGEDTAVELVYDQPDNSDRIQLHISIDWLYTLKGPNQDAIHLKDATGASVDRRARGSGGSWVFEGLEPGTYSLEIRDPRFEPWQELLVETGSTVYARLRGSAAVRLRVQDSDNQQIQDYRLRVGYPDSQSLPNVFELRTLGSPAPEGGRYRGLVPTSAGALEEPVLDREIKSREDLLAAMEAATQALDAPGLPRLVLEVAAPGFATGHAEIRELAPGEVREVVFTLQPEASIQGRILGVDPGEAAGVSVALATASLEFQAARQYLPGDGGGASADARILETESGQDGSFRFSGLAEGSYLLVARFNREFQAEQGPFQVSRGQTTEAQIDATNHASILGRLQAAPADLEGAWIEVLAQVENQQPMGVSAALSRLPKARAQVDDRGNFLIAPLDPGTYALYLHHSPVALGQDRRLWSSRSKEALLLGSVHLPGAHRVDVEFDLSAESRGRITCQATLNGVPAIGWRVEARRITVEPEGSSSRAEGRTGPGGAAHLELLQLGAWNVALVDHDGLWRAWAEAPVDLEPGGEASLNIEVVLHAGQVQLLDASSGQPLRNQYIRWGQRAELVSPQTDAEGRLDLRLPLGTYTLQANGYGSGDRRSEPPVTSLQWTASGPQTAVLRL